MKKLTTLLILLMFAPLIYAAESPEQVMQKAVNKIQTSKGVAGHFKISSPQGSSSGSFRYDGRRYYMEIPQYGRMWYDCKNLYSVNDNTREVTISVPTGEELRESNPFLYLNGYQSGNRLFFSKRKESGKYLVLLNPKSKNADYKAVEIRINASTYVPERIVVRDSQNKVTTVTLSNLSYTRKFMNSDFTFPKSKYSTYETVDMR